MPKVDSLVEECIGKVDLRENSTSVLVIKVNTVGYRMPCWIPFINEVGLKLEIVGSLTLFIELNFAYHQLTI